MRPLARVPLLANVRRSASAYVPMKEVPWGQHDHSLALHEPSLQRDLRHEHLASKPYEHHLHELPRRELLPHELHRHEHPASLVLWGLALRPSREFGPVVVVAESTIHNPR